MWHCSLSPYLQNLPRNWMWNAWLASLEGRAILEPPQKKRYPGKMDTTRHEEEERRRTVLAFWKLHGLDASVDAYGVSRRTLFRWSKAPVRASRAHRNGYAKQVRNPRICAEIVRFRVLHPNLGKEKLAPLLASFCAAEGIPGSSESTVGRMLNDLKAAGRIPSGATLRMSAKTGRLLEKRPQPRRRKLRRNEYVPDGAGDLLQVDGVLIFVESRRRYAFTAVCLVSRRAFSKTYASASSRNGADFLTCLLETAPFPVDRIQTNNGSKFMKEFSEVAEAASLVHFHNWVKQPKYQGWVERFNWTIQKEFLDWHLDAFGGDLDAFNPRLARWLEFYNGSRVHRSLGKPGQRLTPLQYLTISEECQTG